MLTPIDWLNHRIDIDILATVFQISECTPDALNICTDMISPE